MAVLGRLALPYLSVFKWNTPRDLQAFAGFEAGTWGGFPFQRMVSKKTS